MLCKACGIVVADGLVVLSQVRASIATTSAPTETMLATIMVSVCNRVALCWRGSCIFFMLGCVWLHCTSSALRNTRHDGRYSFPSLEQTLATFSCVFVLSQLQMRIPTSFYGWPTWMNPTHLFIVFTHPIATSSFKQQSQQMAQGVGMHTPERTPKTKNQATPIPDDPR